jgi:hypothetical protein
MYGENGVVREERGDTFRALTASYFLKFYSGSFS